MRCTGSECHIGCTGYYWLSQTFQRRNLTLTFVLRHAASLSAHLAPSRILVVLNYGSRPSSTSTYSKARFVISLRVAACPYQLILQLNVCEVCKIYRYQIGNECGCIDYMLSFQEMQCRLTVCKSLQSITYKPRSVTDGL